VSARVSAIVQREVFYSGRVQGVGFRITARGIAARHPVAGFVENLADGRVRLVVEGAGDEVGRFLAAVLAAMADNVSSVQVVEGRPTGRFDRFEIRH
jgi:acylphosphatase